MTRAIAPAWGARRRPKAEAGNELLWSAAFLAWCDQFRSRQREHGPGDFPNRRPLLVSGRFLNQTRTLGTSSMTQIGGSWRSKCRRWRSKPRKSSRCAGHRPRRRRRLRRGATDDRREDARHRRSLARRRRGLRQWAARRPWPRPSCGPTANACAPTGGDCRAERQSNRICSLTSVGLAEAARSKAAIDSANG